MMSGQDTPKWSEQFVSWGHLALAVIAMVITLGGFIVINERRLTVLEEKYLQVASQNAMQDDRYYRQLSIRNAQYEQVLAKLELIQRDISEIKINDARKDGRK